jgi:predicted kinase
MASGKSTLSKSLVLEHNAIALCEDELLAKLYPDEIKTIQDYVKYSERLKEAIRPHLIDLLQNRMSVVIDFPANTQKQREWFKEILEIANVDHFLHYVDKPDDVCKMQLRKRNEGLPKDAPLISEEVFDAITKYFEPPHGNEGFNIIRYVQ